MTEPTFSLDKMIQQAQEAAVSRVPATTDPRSFADTGFQPLNKYDAGLRVGMDQDEYRASQQSLAQAFGNALVQSIREVGLGTLEGIGYMVDLPQWFNIARGTEKEFGNWFSDLMREGKEGIREEMPIYGGSEAFDPGNAKWWMANLPNIASSLSLMIPSVGAVKGLSAAGRLVRGASKLERVAAGTGRAAEKAKAIIGMRQGVQSALFSRYMENTMEAKEAMDSNYEDLIRQGIPENEALERAAQTASNVWRANIANLVTDIPQYMLLMKGPKGLAGAAKETKSIAKKIWDSTPMALGRQAVSEGAEEGFQYGIQQKAKEASGGWDTVKKAIAGVPEFAYDDEFWGSVTLGAAGGVVFEAGGRAAKGIMEKTIDRYKKSSQAYEQGDWVTGLKQQYDEARDMMLRGETDKLRDIASMSEDPKFAPVVEKMVRRMEELSTSIPGIDNKEEVMKLFADNLFYNDAVTDLDTEVKSLMSENASTLNGNKLAKKAFELIEASDATNKEKLKNDILSRFGATKESVEQEEAMTGGMAPVAERKMSQMVDAMKMADQTQKDADTKLREGRQRMQQANQPAAGQAQPRQQQANQQTQLQQQIRNAENLIQNVSSPRDISTILADSISSNEPNEVRKIYTNHAANKMREELDSEDVSMFPDEETYLSALNKDGSFIKEFGDRIRNANGKTANDVARDRWARYVQRVQSQQQSTQQPAASQPTAPPTAPASTMTGMPETETEEQLFPQEPPTQERQEYGTTNTMFTQDAYEEARRKFRGTGNLTAGFDPELLQAAITMAGYHIEAGARSFAAFAKAMIADIGEVVKPYLKPAYNAIRDLNQLDPAVTAQMDDYQTVMATDIDAEMQQETVGTDKAAEEEVKNASIDNEHINPKYRGKIVYASPGAGKTTLANKNSAIIDMDKLIITEITKEAPAFARANENVSDQDFIKRFNGYEVAPGIYGIDARNKINASAVEKARTLTAKGYTVLTGTLGIMDKADEIIILDPESTRKEERFHGRKESLEFSLRELREVKATNRSHVMTDKIESEILGTGQQPPVAAEAQQEPTTDANDEALARQIKALDKGPEPDGTWMAIYKPVPSGQEVEKVFETRSQAEQWLTEKYTEAKRYTSPQYDQSDVQEKEAVQEEPPIQYGDKEVDDRKAILEEAIFDAKGENEVKLDTDYRLSNGREHMFGLTMDVVIETDPVKGTFRPVVVNGKPKTYESVGPATIWTKTGISNTVSYAEAQDYVRHLSDKMDWRNTPVFIEVDPTIEFHQPRSKPTTTPSANPKSPGMDYIDSEIKSERDRFFATNRNMPQDKLEDTWAVEESFMRMPGAKGADNMAVSYVIYDDGKRIPIAMMYSQSLSRQHFGLWRSSPQWMVRYELWKQWKASQEKGITSEPVRHPVTTRFATDGKGNPVYMGGRFLDIPGADFAIEDFKHDTPSGKHLVLMVPIFKAQGTVVEMHNDRPLGRVMNTGNYSPGLPYVLVKDAMGNYLWSRAYSRRLAETGQRGREELSKILSPVAKVKEAFRRRLEQLGYDPDATTIPDDVRAEISRYKPDSKNPIKRSEARFPEVYDFVQTGWKRVADDLSTMFRWREEVNGKTVYGPIVKALRESADGVPSLLFGFNESGPASAFSIDKFIGYYALEERPLQIDVTKIEDTEYVESIAWRLKTNTDPANPMVSPTFFFEIPREGQKEVAELSPTIDEYEGLSEEDIADLEDMKAGRGKYDPEFGINEDGDQPDPEFPEPDDDKDFTVISVYEAIEADYLGKDLNAMEPYLIERLMKMLEDYNDEVTPDYKNRADKDFRKMIDAIDRVAEALYKSQWNDGPWRSKFQVGYQFTEEGYRAQNDFVITRSDQSTLFQGKPLEKGKMAVTRVVKRPLYKQIGTATPILVQRGEVEVLANTAETQSTEQSTAPDPSDNRPVDTFSFKPATKRKLPPTTRFKKADPRRKEVSTKIVEREARAWLAKRISASVAVRIAELDADTYGYTQDALIVLGKGAPSTTTYHEAFHTVFWNLATEEERTALMAAARKKYGAAEQYLIPNGVDPQVWYEEQMAEDFERYVMDRQESDTVIGRFFKTLWNWIQTAIMHRTTIETFYGQIYRGAMTSRPVVSKPFIRYSRVPGLTPKEERAAVDIIMQLIDGSIDEAMAVREQAIRNKKLGNKKDGEVALSDAYRDVLNLRNLFSTQGVMGELVGMAIEDVEGNPVDPSVQAKILAIMKGLNAAILDINFETGEVTGVYKTDEEGNKSLDVIPGPMYFKVLKELSNRGIRVKIRGSKVSFSEEAIGQSDEDQSLEFQEGEEDLREWWSIASHSISMKERLTPRLRRWMSRLPQMTIDGELVMDPIGMGMPLNYNPSEAYPLIQSVLGNSTSVDDMLFRIAEEAKTDPLFASIYWQLASWQTDENQNALATQLFTHIAQKQDPDAYVTKQYSIRDEDGSIIGYRIVNFPSGGRRDAVISDAIMGRLFRLDKKDIAQLTSDMADLLSAQKAIDGKQFAATMKAAGHSVPGATVRNMNAQQYRIVVQGLYNGIRAYSAGREQDAASTIGRTVRSHLAPFIKSRQQSVSLNVTGKKTYAWVNANFVGRQIMRMANNFEAMRSFYVSDAMYKDLPILRNIPVDPWRLVVTDGWKYDKERVGRDYTKFSSKEMLATMISLWRDNVYMLPVFNDSTVMAGVRIMRDKSFEGSIEEILDVAYSEWKRTRNELGAMSDVKSYSKNAAKAVLFEDLLTEKGQVVESFDRDAMRDKLLNMIDDQSKEMVKTMRTTGMISASGPNAMIDMSVTNPEVLAKEFIASHMAVHGQLVLLTMGDPAFYKNPGDFFKRSKEIVSPGTFLNTKAVWTSKSGERVDLAEKPFFKLGIFSDITTDSELYEELKALGLEEEYKKFSLTDGQTFIDIVSYRDREVGLNRWNDEKQDAMDILIAGELPSKKGRSVTFNPFKPFGFTLLKTSDGRIKPMQKKDSELVIYPFYGRKYVGGQRNKFYNPFHKAILEQMGYSFSVDEQGMETTVTYNPDKRRFDMVSSEECIKVGASGIATFPTKESPRGNTVVDDSDPVGTFGQMQEHLFPTEDWRLQQETPPHHLGADAIYGIQTMKLIVADIDLEAEYTTRSGRKIKGGDLVREYKQSIAKDIDTSMEQVEEMFSKADTEEGLKMFADMMRQEVLDRGMPDRFADALELVRDVKTGQLRTKLPLSHPLHVTRMESMLGSWIRKKVTKRKFEKGVSFVNGSPAGFERMPRIVFNADGSIKHYEAYAPIHDKRLLAFVNEEGYIDEQGMDRIRADKDMSQLLDMLVYRTPTEHKYSIFPIHIIGFLPTDDGVMFGPPELTRIAGLDFDIDKVRGFYFAVPKEGKKLTPQQRSDNRKLDLMMAALRHPDVARQMLTPGGFEHIEATNLEIRKRKAWKRVKEHKGALSHNVMDQIEGGIKLIDPMTQVRIARRFNAGQDLIGIAAVNNAVHAIWSQLQDAAFSYSRSIDYRDGSGKSFTLSAMTGRYDASGQEIIRNIASTVAAFVDNGKNPQADYFNMNETTANVAYYLIHIGVPLEGVQMFLSQPAIVWWIEGLINNGGKPTQDMLDRLKKGTNRFYKDYRKSDPTVYLDINDMGNALSREYYQEHVGDDKFDKFQFAMLDNYLVFEKRATDINALVQLTKAGDKGMGASQVDNYKVMRSYERMRDRKKPPFSESFEKIFDQQEEYMAKFLFKGIFRGNELVVKALKTPDLSSGMMTRMVDIFEQIKGTMLTDDEMNAIYRSLYDYLVSSDPNFRMEDMIGERLWKQIEDLGDTYIENNAFLSSLRMLGEDLQMPIGTMVDHSEEAMITADWKVLLEDHPQLAIDLARYSVMRNGFRYAPGGFSHLQPLELYTGAFADLYSNYLSALAQMQYDMALAGNYVKQFLQNNHTSMSMVQEVFAVEEGSDMPGPSVITLDGETLGFVIEVGEPDKMPYLYKYQGNLYELTARGTDRYYYERIPTYGAGDRNKIYQEYYFGNTGNEDQSGIFEKEITVKQKIYSRNKAATMVTNIDFKANKDPQSLIDNCA